MRPPVTKQEHQKLSLNYLPQFHLIRVVKRLHVLDTGARIEQHNSFAGFQGAELHPLQQTFADLGAAQCGYCSPGFLLVAEELLTKTPNPSRAEIQEALSGNLCRCTGYLKIYEAVELAAVQMREEDSSAKMQGR